MNPEHRLTEDVEQALPGRHNGRRWDQRIALRLVDPVASKPPEPVTPVHVLPANVVAIAQAEAAVRDAETCAQRAEARLRALLSGQQAATEPAASAPVPKPPSSAVGWDVSKKVIRDAAGLVVEVAETWRPAAEPA